MTLNKTDIEQIASYATDAAIEALQAGLKRRSLELDDAREQHLRAFLDGFFETGLIMDFGVTKAEEARS